jgi:hypothetical protein
MSENELLRTDFGATGRDILIATYEREIEGDKLPPSFEGKPLDHLLLNFVRVRQPSAVTTVTEERLEIQPIANEDVNEMRDLPQYADSPEYVFELFTTVARTLARTGLSRAIRLRDVVPHGAAVTTYFAEHLNKKDDVLISSLHDEPTLESLASGQRFALAAKEYVNSPRFYDIKVIGRQTELGEDEREGRIEHKLGYDISPRLPLNGHEPINFLELYYKNMTIELHHIYLQMQNATNAGASPAVIGKYTDKLALITSARDRAKALLDAKDN